MKSSCLSVLALLILFALYSLAGSVLHAYPLNGPSGRDLIRLAGSEPGLSVFQRDGTAEIRGRIFIRDLAGSKDGDHAFEGLDVMLNLAIEGDLASAVPTFRWSVKAAWPKGQVLFYPWFLDLSEIKGSLRAKGRMDGRALLVDDFRLYGPFSLEAGSVVIPLAGTKGSSDLLDTLLGSNWRLDADLGRAYGIFVKDAFSDSHPLVQEIEPSGTVLVQGRPDAVSALLKCDIRFKGKDFVKGLEARISYPLARGACEEGAVRWQELSLAPLIPAGLFKQTASIALSGKSLPVTLCRNRVRVGPLRLELGRGRVSLGLARFDFSRGTLMLDDIEMTDIELHRLVQGLPFDAVISGLLPEARFERQRLVFKGKIDVRVADGLVEIENIWMEPYAPIPRWGADISLRHIDLARLTRGTSFGLVTGRIKGWIKGLVMSGGQPEAFDLRIETDESSKEDRKISIKAIENLSILGGGGGSVSFLGQLFKEFSYSRIGISCRLRNDVFELHGLYKSGDKEYLVKRGFWGGVNVINMNPKGRISFTDMLDRLKRIGESGQSKVEVR